MFQKLLLLLITFFVACSAPNPLSINAPDSLNMRQGQSLQLTASGASGLRWSVVPSDLGTFSNLGSRASYVAPNLILQPQTVVITARNALDLNQTASVTVYLQPDSTSDSLRIFPLEVRSLPVNTRVTLTATNPDVLWSVLEDKGVIGATGEFIAPALVPYPAVVTIRATSKSNASLFAQIQLGIVGNTGIAGMISLPTKLIQPPKLQVQTATLEPRGVRRAKADWNAARVNGEVLMLGDATRLSSSRLRTARIENGFVRVKVPTGVSDVVFAEQLRLETGAMVQPNYLYRLLDAPNDPLFAEQRSLLQIDAPGAWFSQILVPDNLIAVLDTGVQVNHADLLGRINSGKDFCPVFTTACQGEDADPTELSASQGGGHGTFATGIIAAKTNNHTGMAGITQGGKILVVKVFGADNIGAIADTVALAKGIRYAVQQGAKVISMSLGVCTSQQSEFDTPDLITENAIGYATGQGALLVAASGNNGNNGSQCGSDTSVQFPGSHPDVLAVGSVNPSNIRSGFSATGSALDLVAPGEGLLSLGLDNNLEKKSGTSFAAPQVAAVAGLMFAKNPTLTRVAVQQILENTALDLGSAGKDPSYGAGLLQAGTALVRASESSEPVTTAVLYAFRLRDTTNADCTVINELNSDCYENTESGMEIVSVRGSSGLVAYNINRSKDGNALQAGTYRVVACVNQNSNALLCDPGDFGTPEVLNLRFDGSSILNVDFILHRI